MSDYAMPISASAMEFLQRLARTHEFTQREGSWIYCVIPIPFRSLVWLGLVEVAEDERHARLTDFGWAMLVDGLEVA